MKSFTTANALYGTWTKNTDTGNLSYGAQIANDYYRHICALKDWSFLDGYRAMLTVGQQQFYPLFYDTDLVREINVKVSSITYTPKLSPSRQHWDSLNLVSFVSDIPQWYFIFENQVGLWPVPASTGNTINVTQKCRVIDLQFTDYTTGTISAITNGSNIVTGSGTTWGTGMAGEWIKITPTAATNGGDGIWYLIGSVTNSTTLVLVANYGGATITTGSAAFVIGQMPLLPEAFQDTPWKAAAADYWTKESDERGAAFQTKYETDIADLIKAYSAPSTDMVIDDGSDFSIVNPNLFITLG